MITPLSRTSTRSDISRGETHFMCDSDIGFAREFDQQQHQGVATARALARRPRFGAASRPHVPNSSPRSFSGRNGTGHSDTVTETEEIRNTLFHFAWRDRYVVHAVEHRRDARA